MSTMETLDEFRRNARPSDWNDPAGALLLIVRSLRDSPSARQFRTGTDEGAGVPVPPLTAAIASSETLAAPLRKRENSPYAEFIFLGRSVTADILLKDASISKSHAAFQRDEPGSGWFVKDVRSRNGTYVDGRRLEHGERVKIQSGTQITFGTVPAYFVELPYLKRFALDG